jgi:hypothetical protein
MEEIHQRHIHKAVLEAEIIFLYQTCSHSLIFLNCWITLDEKYMGRKKYSLALH